MTFGIKDFSHAVRLGLGLRLECGCGKRVVYRASDFIGHIRHGAQLEDLRFRCRWCGAEAADARYQDVKRMDRVDIAQWTPNDRPRHPTG